MSENKGEKSECTKIFQKIREKRVLFQRFVTSIVASKSTILSATQSVSQSVSQSVIETVSQSIGQ